MARILVIDDDVQLRRLFVTILKRQGHEVLDAEDGDGGLGLYRQQQFDLVITDLIMPGKEGIETIMELRKIHPAVKIIAVSGGGRMGPEGYLSTAKSLGASETLTKPVEMDHFISTVNSVLSNG
jgi:CheY-like chemotaxis protein